MTAYVLPLREVDRTTMQLAGGKGANLGELTTINGVHVPEGFCVTSEAYRSVIEGRLGPSGLLEALARVKAVDRATIGTICAQVRAVIETTPMPVQMREEIVAAHARLGERNAFAVRSSATAEDLPSASFAGQQDTYLNVIGADAVLEHVSRCWASLFTDRAVVYRIQNGFDHRRVLLAVVIQRMIPAQVAGVLFTADPSTGNRKVTAVDASFGLGEALVSGLVTADHYKMRDGRVIDKRVGTKTLAVVAVEGGGTSRRALEPEQQKRQALTDEQAVELERLGRIIEAHFGCPQDIEWCLADGVVHIVQSRPITTLFPVPEVQDADNHVYISVGHQQMMTDPIRPLGLSFFRLTAGRLMADAAGRLFVDIAPNLASPATRKANVETLGQDPLIKDALTMILDRGDFIKPLRSDEAAPGPVPSPVGFRNQVNDDPQVVTSLMERSRTAVLALQKTIQTQSGTAVFDCIRDDIGEMRKHMFEHLRLIMAAMDAAAWINETMKAWLGETNAADTLSQSVPNNVTSEMGLALLDLADQIRPHQDVVAFLERTNNDRFLEDLARIPGGREVRDAIQAYLGKYGMRCAGEIDITNPRWSEKPLTLVPVLLGNVKNFEPGAGKRRFEAGRQNALKKEQELLGRIVALPDGARRAEETQRMIGLIRNFSGYREYPKYGMVSRYFVYKQALLKEAGTLVQAGVIADRDDIYYLSFEELREAVRTRQLDDALVPRRKDAYRLYEKLSPPRVMTSEGEIVRGTYKRDNIPPAAIIGLPVSSGVVEGRARVIASLEAAALAPGDILVTTFTDPSWTPLFVSVKGLVTEVGGLMTHGAVIAREYGLPAVVGVEHATKLIQDGQRIRVNGTEGYVEIL